MTRITRTKALLCRFLAVLVLLAMAVPPLGHAGKAPRKADPKAAFLRANKLKCVPKGFVISHKVPLWKGGKDVPSNLELISDWEKGVRERREAREQAWQSSVQVKSAKTVPPMRGVTPACVKAAPVKSEQGERQAGL